MTPHIFLRRFVFFLTVGLGPLLLLYACGCGDGSVCGSSNTVAPSSLVATNSTNVAPSPNPSPNACVPQNSLFTCSKGGSAFLPILDAVQSNLPSAPEPIYVASLVEALNKRGDVCAQAGPSPDEVSIKARVSNSMSETWDVVRADGAPQALPVTICTPARF